MSELANRIVAGVRAVYPAISVGERATDAETVIDFLPVNDGGVSVTVTVTGTAILVEALSFAEDLGTEGDLDTQAVVAGRLVLSFAEHGLTCVRTLTRRFPFVDYVTGPSSGFWGVDDYAQAPWRSIVETLEPWADAREAVLLS